MQRNKFQKPEKMEFPAPKTAEAAGMFLKFKNSSKIIQTANQLQKFPGTSKEHEEEMDKKKSSDSIQKGAQNAEVLEGREAAGFLHIMQHYPENKFKIKFKVQRKNPQK